MTIKGEIEKRLKKANYKAISRKLHHKNFDDLTENEYKDILKIADIYGSKYIKIYKLKNDINIEQDIIRNLETKDYQPNLEAHSDLNIIGVYKDNESFTIYTEFYTVEEEWEDTLIEGQPYKKKIKVDSRRVMVLRKLAEKNFLVLSIDPIGKGPQVYKKIESNLNDLNKLIKLDINAIFDNIEIEGPIYDLINQNKIIPNKLEAKDLSTKRIKSVQALTKDNISDEKVYKMCKSNNLQLQNMKMKFNKETIELYGKSLLKISTRADEGATNELTNSIISIL